MNCSLRDWHPRRLLQYQIQERDGVDQILQGSLTIHKQRQISGGDFRVKALAGIMEEFFQRVGIQVVWKSLHEEVPHLEDRARKEHGFIERVRVDR